MSHGAHGASGSVSSGNRPDREREGPGGASDCGIRSAERRLGSGRHRSKGSKRHVLQRAKRRSATPRPVTGFELVKQRISRLEDQQREDGEVLRRLEQVLQGNWRSTELASSGDEGLGVDSRVSKRLSELESRVFGRSSASMELDAMMTDDSAEFGDCGDMVDVAGEGRSAGMIPFSSSMMWGDVKVDDVGEGLALGDVFAVFGDCGVEFDVIGEGRLADVLQERDGMGGLAAHSGFQRQ